MNKIYREVHYSADDNGVCLKVSAEAGEATLVVCNQEIEIGGGTNLNLFIFNLEEIRDLLQAAIDDLAIPSLEAITDADYTKSA